MRRPPRARALVGALSLALAPAAEEAAAAAAMACPDARTIEAARLVEFQTMMMGVSVRCRYVGVPIGEHLDGMNSARRTMFSEAHDRVASYLRSLNTRFGPATAPLSQPAPGAVIAAPAAPAKPAARIARRTDPYDRYLTMIGNQYGGGTTTLQRCKAFDTIALSLADKASTDHLLTMVSASLVQDTLLEAIVNCPAGRK